VQLPLWDKGLKPEIRPRAHGLPEFTLQGFIPGGDSPCGVRTGRLCWVCRVSGERAVEQNGRERQDDSLTGREDEKAGKRENGTDRGRLSVRPLLSSLIRWYSLLCRCRSFSCFSIRLLYSRRSYGNRMRELDVGSFIIRHSGLDIRQTRSGSIGLSDRIVNA